MSFWFVQNGLRLHDLAQLIFLLRFIAIAFKRSGRLFKFFNFLLPLAGCHFQVPVVLRGDQVLANVGAKCLE
jgi:hypothetical protein